MQKKAHGAVLAILMTSLLAAPIAEAKRAGGGKSSGMSRLPSSSQSSNQNQNTQFRNQTPTPAQQVPQQRSGSNVGGMVAAGVAGAAIGAVAANAMADDGQQSNPNKQAENWQNGEQTAAQEEKSSFNWLWILALAAAGFFLFRKFAAKKKLANAGGNPFSPNNTASTRNQNTSAFGQAPAGSNTNIFGQSVSGNAAASQAPFGSATMSSGNQLPDGTEPATFLRFARQRFNHIQAMNNPTNIQEISKYFTADMYQEIYSDVANNTDVAEFSNLTANVVDQATENGQYIVSVRFTGTVSEDLNSLPQPFTEIWHFVKPVVSQDEWLVAGIQQA